MVILGKPKNRLHRQRLQLHYINTRWEFRSFTDEINGLAVRRNRFTRFWNSEARFVVAGAIEFSMSQQTNILDYSQNLE